MPDQPPLEKYLTFVLGDEEYGVEIQRVREIIAVSPITRVPKSAPAVRGVVNLRGKVVPIVDLKLALELPTTSARETCFVIVELRGARVGIVVDEVKDVVAIPASDVESPPLGPDVNMRCLRGIAKRGKSVRMLLDLDRVLPQGAAVPVPSAV